MTRQVRQSSRRLAVRSLLLLVVVAGVVGLVASPASADQFSPWGSSAGVQTYTNQFADTCWLAVGPVFDPRPKDAAGRFAIIGGLTVQGCSRRHSFQAFVYEFYGSSPTGPWHQVAQASTWLPNAYGFGTCSGCPSGRILETPRICGGGSLYWYTSSAVREYDTYGRFVRQISLSGSVGITPVQATATC